MPWPGPRRTRTRGAAIARDRRHRGLDGHGHVHNDPATKNAISRSSEAAAAPDPTTPAQRAASRSRVAAQRTQREPQLVGRAAAERRRLVPEGAYAMAGGCYRLGGRPLTFQATGLGSYLLYAPDRTFLAASGLGRRRLGGVPVARVDWTVRRPARGCSPSPSLTAAAAT